MSRYIVIFSSQPAPALQWAQTLSPRVEMHPTGGIILPVPARYERQTLDQLLELGIASGRIDFASASTRTTALFAARLRPGSSVPEGDEQSFLASFPLRILALSGLDIQAHLLETLAVWGIRTLGELAAIPPMDLLSRLGPEGLPLQKLARGEEVFPPQPYLEAPRFETEAELEWELDNLESLAFTLADLLDNLCSSLQSHGLAASRLFIQLKLANQEPYERSLPLAFPMQDSKVLLSLLRLKLQSDPPLSGIQKVWLKAEPAKPQVLQHSLLEPASPHPEKLARTLVRLRMLVGEDKLGSPVILDSHRPDAVVLDPFSPLPLRAKRRSRTPRRQPDIGSIRERSPGPGRGQEDPCKNRTRPALRRLRPPLPFRLQTEKVVACAGPWRSSGEWWQTATAAQNNIVADSNRFEDPANPYPHLWARDEWDIELVDGRICRIYWDLNSQKCFLEGVYD